MLYFKAQGKQKKYGVSLGAFISQHDSISFLLFHWRSLFQLLGYTVCVISLEVLSTDKK